MALPVIKLNNLTGSDTAASGAGPGDGTTGGSALTGANASTSSDGLTVTLPNADLTHVLTDGSHALWLSTSSGRKWGKITGKANSGASNASVTVAAAYAGSLSSQTYALGGKRANWGNLARLMYGGSFQANGDCNDSSGAWEIRFEATGTPYSVTSSMTGSWVNTNYLKLTASGGTVQVNLGNVTFLAVEYGVLLVGPGFHFNATTSGQGTVFGDSFEGLALRLRGVRFTNLNRGIDFDNNYSNFYVTGCLFEGCTTGIRVNRTYGTDHAKFNRFVQCATGISYQGSSTTLTALGNQFANGTLGMEMTPSTNHLVESNTFAGQSSCGLKLISATTAGDYKIASNLFWGGQYGIDDNTAGNWVHDSIAFSYVGNAFGGQSTSPYKSRSFHATDVNLLSNPFTDLSGGDLSLTAAGAAAVLGAGLAAPWESVYPSKQPIGATAGGGGSSAPRFGAGGNFYV